jgi:signal transduction histidine kinase
VDVGRLSRAKRPGSEEGHFAVLASIQVLVIFGIVGCFLGSTWIGAVRASRIDVPLEDIVANAMPSVLRLSAARLALHQLDVDLVAYSTEPTVRPSLWRERGDLEREWARYELLPTFPGEPHLMAIGGGELKELLQALDAVHVKSSLGDRHGALGQAAFAHNSAAELDRTLDALIDLNASRGETLGLAALTARREVRDFVVFLSFTSAALAALATVLAVVVLRRALRSLALANASAEERAQVSEQKNAELEQFAGRMAHDVMSPLMAASMALDLVHRGIGSGHDLVRPVERGIASVHRARRIVEGLLDFARSGAAPDPRGRAFPREVLEDVVEGLKADAEAQHIELSLAPPPTCEVRCSAGVLTSVVSNLVNNAIRYMGSAERRRVTVRARVEGALLVVDVEDTGPGVPRGLEEAIFEPFVRGCDDVPGGIGLGLATVKRVVQAYGGRVGYEVGTAGGSRFWFELPCVASVARARVSERFLMR